MFHHSRKGSHSYATRQAPKGEKAGEKTEATPRRRANSPCFIGKQGLSEYQTGAV